MKEETKSRAGEAFQKAIERDPQLARGMDKAKRNLRQWGEAVNIVNKITEKAKDN